MIKFEKKGSKNLEKLHCPNFPQSWGLRLEKHLQGKMIKKYFNFDRAKNISPFLDAKIFQVLVSCLLPRFLDIHILSGQEEGHGTCWMLERRSWFFRLCPLLMIHDGDAAPGHNFQNRPDFSVGARAQTRLGSSVMKKSSIPGCYHRGHHH